MRIITIHDRSDNDSVDATITSDGQNVQIDTDYPMLENDLRELQQQFPDPNAFMDAIMSRYANGTVVYAVETGAPVPQAGPMAPLPPELKAPPLQGPQPAPAPSGPAWQGVL